MRVIDRQLLQDLSSQARQHPRLRKNLDFHRSLDSRGHRFLNAIEPGSYIIPHRHLDQEKDETLVVLSGELGVVTFDDSGAVLQAVRLSAGGERVGVDLRHDVYHCAVSLASGTVFLEAKAGPYKPLSESERAPWAPAEGTAEVSAHIARLVALFSQEDC